MTKQKNSENTQPSGIFPNYGDLLSFFKYKSKELRGCGCGLVLSSGNIYFQFTDPATRKRKKAPTGIKLDSDESVIIAGAKARRVGEKLKSCKTASEFWNWFNEEIKPQKPVNDFKTYRQIFQEIEDEYFRGKHRNTGRKRIKDITQPGGANDLKSFNRQYGDFFERIPDWDKYPDWEEIKAVWFTIGADSPEAKKAGLPNGQGTKSFKNAKTTVRKILERMPNSETLLKKMHAIDATQTVFAEKQVITLSDFLNWYHQAYNEIPSLRTKIERESREGWLWVAAICVLYGLRPSEVASAQNLFKPYTDKKTGKTVYPLSDKKRNPQAILIIGEFTYFGVSTKTGTSLVMPVPSPALIEKLCIRNPKLPEYHPEPGAKPETIVTGFNKAFSKRMQSAKCPVTQLYAFRRLHNDLLKMYGIDTSVRSRNMGYTATTNDRFYDPTGENFKNDVEFFENLKKQALPYEAAIFELQNEGIDTELPEIQAILKIIYQLED